MCHRVQDDDEEVMMPDADDADDRTCQDYTNQNRTLDRHRQT